MLGLRRLRSNLLLCGAVLVLALVELTACGRGEPDGMRLASQLKQASEAPVWNNGGFENGVSGSNPNGWTVSAALNSTGLVGFSPPFPPTVYTQITTGVGGFSESLPAGPYTTYTMNDNDLGSSVDFRYPRYGSYSDIVNFNGYVQNGNNQNLNTLQQTMTVGLGDIDPADGQLHIRFAYAPVLEYPAHVFTQQPFFMVNLINVSRGNSVLFSQFSVSGGQGVPWQTTTGVVQGNPTQWVDWALADITPVQGSYALGDQVQLTIVAAGCQPTGHFGRVYVDGVGMVVPGPFVSATAPTQAAVNANITYRLHYANGAATTETGVFISITTPLGTDFIPNSIQGLSNCTVSGSSTNPQFPSNPNYTATGPVLISCPVGTLAPSSYGNFSFQVQVESTSTTNALIFANYGITAIGYPQLLGSQVSTLISNGVVSDVAVSYPNPVASVNWNQNLTYTLTVTNNGNTLTEGAVNVVYPQPGDFTTMTWSCATVSNANCVSTSGTGSLSEYPQFGAGGSVTYTLTGTVEPGSGTGYTSSTFAANVISSAVDPLPYNNTQLVGFNIGTPERLTVTNIGGNGTVTTTPAGISNNSNNVAQSANFAVNSNVQLSVNPNAGSAFVGWGGACASYGTASSCTIAMTANANVTATFSAPYATPSPASATQIIALQGSGQYAQTSSTFSTPLWALVTDANGTPVPGVSVTFVNANATYSPSATVTTDGNGLAKVSVTAGSTVTATPYAVKATAAVTGNPNVSFNLTNVGTPSNIVYVQGGGATTDRQKGSTNGEFPIPLMALVTDVNNNPVPNANVTYANPAGTPTANLTNVPSVVITDGAGHSTLYGLANGTSGTYTIRATATGAAGNATFYLNNVAPNPTNIDIVSGTPQAVLASTSNSNSTFGQPLTVAVSDNNGLALANVAVTFTSVANGSITGLVNSGTTAVATTNTFGYASVTAIAGTAYGTWTVSAATNGLTAVTFSLTNNGTQFLNIVSGAPQSTEVGTAFGLPFAVKLTNSAGVPVANANVTFTAPSSGSTVFLSANANITDVNGVASVTGNANLVAGSYTITASNPNSTNPQSFALTNTPGPAAAVVGVLGSGQNANVNTAFTNPLVLEVTDTWGNAISNAAVTFTIVNPNSMATAIFTTPNSVTNPNVYITTTGANGDANVAITAGLIANTTATPTYGVVASTSVGSFTFTLSNNPGLATQMVLTPSTAPATPFAATVSTNFIAPLTVYIEDTYGNHITGAQVTFTEASAGNKAGATLNGSTAAQVVATSGSPAQAQVTANANSTASTAGSNYTVTVTSSGLAASKFYLFNAASGSTPLAFMNPNNTGSVTYSVPVGQVVGAYPPQAASFVPWSVLVEDASHNPAANVSVTFTVTASGGAGATFAGGATTATVITNASGVATASPIASGTTGAYTISATVAGVVVTGGTANILNSGGTPANLTIQPNAAAAAQSANVLTAFSSPGVRIRLTDSSGNGVGGAAVTFTQPTSGATVALNGNSPGIPAVATTDVNGYVPSSSGWMSANANALAGNYNVVVTSSGLSTTYTFTNTPGSPTIVTTGGTPQNGNLSTAYATKLQGRVQDAEGNPIAGYLVTFSAPPSGASGTFSPTSFTTDVSGNFNTTFTANTTAGTFTATAKAGTATGSYILTNLPGAPNILSVQPSSAQSAQSANVMTPYSPGLEVRLTDSYGNGISGASITFSPPASGATVGLNGQGAGTTFTSTTDSAGYLPSSTTYVAANANALAGNYNIVVTSSGLTTTFSFTNRPGLATKVAVTGGSPQNGNLATAFGTPLQGKVQDAYGNGIPFAAVTFAAPSSGASATLSPNLVTTDLNGNFNTTATANTAIGSYAVTASSSGATPGSYALNNLAGSPNMLIIEPNAAAASQSANVMTAFSPGLQVRVTDAYSNPVIGASVTFTPPTSGATVALAGLGAGAPYTATTDANGYVPSSTTYITANANALAGNYNIVVTSSGLTNTFVFTNTPGVPTVLVATGGGSQNANLTTAYGTPLQGQVRDAYGNPVAGVAITFSAPTSGASATLSPNTITSDANGNFQTTATANTAAGGFAVTAQSSGLTSATYNLTNLAGSPNALIVVGTAPVSAVVGTPFGSGFEVELVDQYNNPISGGNVIFRAPGSEPTAAISPNIVVTDANGMATTTPTAGTLVGGYPITASYNGLSVVFNVNNTVGPAAQLLASSGTPQNGDVGAAYRTPLTATLMDNYNNVIAGAQVTFTATPSVQGAGATLSPNVLATDANGNAAVTANANNVLGAFTVTASTASGVSAGNLTATFDLTNMAGTPNAIVIDPNTNNQTTLVGTAFANNLVLQVIDVYGNPVDANVLFTPPSSGPTATINPNLIETNPSGGVSVQAVANSHIGTYTVTAGIPGYPITATFTLTNAPGAPVSIIVVSGGGTGSTPPQTAAVQDPFTQPLVAEVVDQYNNAVPHALVAFSVPGSGPSASLSAASAVSDANGRVSVNATALTIAGDFNVTARLPVTGNPNAAFELVTLPGPVASLVVDANDMGGQATDTNTTFAEPLGLTAEDQFGNPVSNATIDFMAPASGPSATLSATQGATDANGHIQIIATANREPGDYPVTAYLNGSGTPVAYFALTNSPVPVLTLVASSSNGSPQSANVTTAFAYPLSVQVLDANSNPVVGRVVHFSAPGSGASATLSANANSTDATGTALVMATANTMAGTYDVVVNVLGGSAPLVFVLTNVPGAPASISAVPGSTPQLTLVNDQFVAPLTVVVLDANNNPVPNVPVNWSPPVGTPTATLAPSSTITTDNSGQSSVIATADGTPGSYTVDASINVGGSTLQTTFVLTNSLTPGVTLLLTQGGGQAATVDTNFTNALVFEVVDPNGNPVPGDTVQLTATHNDATFTATSGAATDANGVQQFLGTAGIVAGTYTVAATVLSGSNVVSTVPLVFSLTNMAGPAFTLSASSSSPSALPNPQSTAVNHFFPQPLVAYVVDLYGNPVAFEIVTFSGPAAEPNAVLSSLTVSSDSTGMVQVVAVAGGIAGGPYDVVAAFGSGTYLPFHLTNLADPPNTIKLVSGDNQSVTVGNAFAPVTFVVYDASEYVASDVAVNFTSTPTMSLNRPSATTNADGQVTVTATAPSAGTYQLMAAAANALVPATATLTATPIPTIPTTTAITDTKSAVTLGVPFKVHATVSAAVGAPTGQVQFTSDGSVIGTSPLDATGASLSTSPPSLGQHNIGAHYLPTVGSPYQASEAQKQLVVVTVGWYALGNNCAQGSAQTWVLVLLGAATMLWHVRRRKTRADQ